MEIYQFKSLLEQVNTLNHHYRKINDLTGENFNIFKILKLESSEVRLHSSFLAELLNPKGSHGQQDIFLKLFIQSFCFKNNLVDTESCKVAIEKHTGFISSDGTEGGRLDIVISDKYNNHIIIENKIYAGDQANQLTRYYKYSNNSDLIYLTLDGKDPSDGSKGDLVNGTHFKCYSYKSDILQWLELCRKEVTIYPIVRESLTQYINLIKHLTNQTLNQSMEKELSQLLKVNLEASFSIKYNLDNALKEVLKDFIVEMEGSCEELGLNFNSNINLEKNYTGLWISKQDWKYVSIGFQFQSFNKDVVYGFATKKHPKENSTPPELLKSLGSLSNNSPKPNGWWPWYNRLEEPYTNWSKYRAWKAIVDGSMKGIMIEKIKELVGATQNMEL